MKGRLISVTALFSTLIIIVAGVFFYTEKHANSQDNRSEQLVAINEIEQLVKTGEYEKLSEKTAELSESIRSSEAVSNVNVGIFILNTNKIQEKICAEIQYKKAKAFQDCRLDFF